ncbi:tetratricopeptide repeat protein [Cyclobacteriaceae bacterium YHN15]|nr:tetratricopeptide repeat protein [Cyclobacteriaceae bacterium YHN15]
MNHVSIILGLFYVFLVDFVEVNLAKQNQKTVLEAAEFMMESNPDSSYFYLKLARDNAQQAGNEKEIGLAYHGLGKLLYHKGIYSQSLENLLLAEEIFEKLKYDSATVLNRNFLGKLFYKTKGIQEAIQMHEDALLLAQKTKDKFGEAYSLSMLGGMYEKSGDYPKALQYQWNAKSLLQFLDDRYLLPEIFENIGSIYEDLQDLDSAYFYFNKAYDVSVYLGDNINLISKLNNLGDVKRKKHQKEEALSYYFEALKLSRELQEAYQESSALRDIAKTYADFEDFRLAYSYLDSGRMVYQMIFSNETATQQVLIDDLFMLKVKEQQIMELENEKAYNLKIRWYLIILLLLLIGLILVVYSRQRLKVITEKKMGEQQKQLFEASKKLMEAELAQRKLEEEKLSKELESNAKALSVETLHVIEKNKILTDIRERLKNSLDDDVKVQKKKIKNLLKLIEHNFVQDTDWEDFKVSFEKVHEDFFKKLHGFSQELSPADLKLASLMKMNLGSKDIASILEISPESLRVSRYRLRKKMKLEKGESLQQFILSL